MLSRVFSVDSQQKKCHCVSLLNLTLHTCPCHHHLIINCEDVNVFLNLLNRPGLFLTRARRNNRLRHSFILLCSMAEWWVSSEILSRFNLFSVYKFITFAFRSPALRALPLPHHMCTCWNGDWRCEPLPPSTIREGGAGVPPFTFGHSPMWCLLQSVVAAGVELHCSCFPDKICDQISDAVLDAHLKQDPDAKVACGKEKKLFSGDVYVCTGQMFFIDSGILRVISPLSCAETVAKTGMILLAGEVTSRATVDYQKVVRDTIRQIGYDDSCKGMACCCISCFSGCGCCCCCPWST